MQRGGEAVPCIKHCQIYIFKKKIPHQLPAERWGYVGTAPLPRSYLPWEGRFLGKQVIPGSYHAHLSQGLAVLQGPGLVWRFSIFPQGLSASLVGDRGNGNVGSVHGVVPLERWLWGHFPWILFRFRQVLNEQYLARKEFYFPSGKFALPSAELPGWGEEVTPSQEQPHRYCEEHLNIILWVDNPLSTLLTQVGHLFRIN